MTKLYFCEKFYLFKELEKWTINEPKIGFFGFNEKFGHLAKFSGYI